MVQWLGLLASTAGDLDSVTGWRTKIPQASRQDQKSINKNSNEKLKRQVKLILIMCFKPAYPKYCHSSINRYKRHYEWDDILKILNLWNQCGSYSTFQFRDNFFCLLCSKISTKHIVEIVHSYTKVVPNILESFLITELKLS